jgi:hypothetical protein
MLLAAKVNVALLVPLIAISLLLLGVCLFDLARREHVTGGNKWVWLAVILIGGTVGQIVYLAAGRRDA